AILQETLEEEAKRLGFTDLYEFWTSPHNPYIAYPTRLRSLVTAADGASAMVLSDADGARAYDGLRGELLGRGISVGGRPRYQQAATRFPADVIALRAAYAMADSRPEQIGSLHAHDCSRISGLTNAEPSGYLPQGKGLIYAAEGRLRFNGDPPMSTHGGR